MVWSMLGTVGQPRRASYLSALVKGNAMSPRSHHQSSAVISLLLMTLPAMYLSVAYAQSIPTVLINEFMPNTGNDSSQAEWVELFNPNPFPFDISGWHID